MTTHTIIISSRALRHLLRHATSLTLSHNGAGIISIGAGAAACTAECKSAPFEYAMKLEQANRLAAIMDQLTEQPVVLIIEEGRFHITLTQLSI